MSPPSGHWSLVVVGARMAGAAAAYALAPFAGRVLLLDRSDPAAFWPQQVSWDRRGALLLGQLGLLDTVLALGAPRMRSHTFRTADADVRYVYPDRDEHCYRMSVAREVLDPALAAAACRGPNVTLVRPAAVRDVVVRRGRVEGVTFTWRDSLHTVTADLLVLACGRSSRLPDLVGARPDRVVPSPWLTLLAYHRGLRLPPGHGYYSRQPGTMLAAMACGPDEWCLSVSIHRRLLESSGQRPAELYLRTLRRDPDIGPALQSSRRSTPIGGAGKLRMLRRPMCGPGWCLVGDCGYHLDPMVALGARAALVTVGLLLDRVAEVGEVTRAPEAYADVGDRRDTGMADDWARTERVIGTYAPTGEAVSRARALAADPAAADAEISRQMGLAPVGATG